MAKRILLVDDDRLNITLLKFAFKEDGFEVVSAENGQDGLSAVKQGRPDIIVLDIQMPGMSGFEFMKELKSLPDCAGIPVLMLTANENMQEVFLSEGVKGYFVKPVDPPELLAKVRDLLG